MRKGFFWNYMEDMPVRARVKEEDGPALQPDVCSMIRKICFLRLLITKTESTLKPIMHSRTEPVLVVFEDSGLRVSEGKISREDFRKCERKAADGCGQRTRRWRAVFLKYYRKERPGKEIPKYKAHQLSYRKLEHGDFRLRGAADTGEILQAAKKHGTTVTAFLTAVYLMAAVNT